MKNKGKIGVILATYNGEKYIKEQLNSILNQSIKPNYIVISDGGSIDNTSKICKEILEKNNIEYNILTSDIRLSVKENFQKALIKCNTDYIFFSDQDDVWLENKIETTMNYFLDEKVCMVFCNAKIVDDNLKLISSKSLWDKIGYSNKTKAIYEKNSKTFLGILIKHNVVTGMCMAISKKLKNVIIPFSDSAIHDVWTAFIAINFGNVVAINEKNVLYRQHKNNAIGTKSGIVNSIKHKSGYACRVKDRLNFINDILENKKICIEANNRKKLEEYKNFLKKRILYLNGKSGFCWLISNLKLYSKYEYRAYQIVLKDFIYNLLQIRQGGCGGKNG